MTSTIEQTETVLSESTLRVIRNMAAKMQHVQVRYPETGPEAEALGTREGIDAFQRKYQSDLAEMARTFAVAMTYVATPGVRLWPDNGREDCVSLSGSLHGMSFGIIFFEKSNGTGSWGFHS